MHYRTIQTVLFLSMFLCFGTIQVYSQALDIINSTGDTLLHVKNDGKVGIATSDPKQALHVVASGGLLPPMGNEGAVVQNNAAANIFAGIVLIGGETGGAFLDFGDKDNKDVGFINYQHSGDNMRFATNGGQTRMIIASDGNVGIGPGFGFGGGTPNEQLEITANFRLPATTATTGIIKSVDSTLIHTFGDENFFAGVHAGNLTMSGLGQNTGVGYKALLNNTTGDRNTAIGRMALLTNNTGHSNTATGRTALGLNTSGHSNTASGRSALFSNTSGVENVAIGRNGLVTNSTGSQNTTIGYSADVSVDGLSNSTAIGANAVVNASNKIRLGDANITVIEGQVDFTFSSDSTKKENFLPTDGEEVLQKLRRFRLGSWNYKGQNAAKFRHYGPMAQDFYAAFGYDGVGTVGTDTTLTGSDINGINMIAVQALEKRTAEFKVRTEEIKTLKKIVAEQDAELKNVKSQLVEFNTLKSRMAKIEGALQKIAVATAQENVSRTAYVSRAGSATLRGK